MYPIGHRGWLSASQRIIDATVCLELQVNEGADPSKTDFHTQADRVACHIANTFHTVPYLALSGGLDSEYVAETLKRNKIHFVPLILKIGTLNQPEYKYAEEWCERNNFNPHIIQISPEKLVSRLQVSVRDEFLTTNLGGFINVYLADYIKEKFDSVLITGSGDPTTNPYGIYSDEPPLDTFYYWDVDLMTDILRPGKHPHPFISYNPNILYSYMYNYDTTLPEQKAKSKLYQIPYREKSEVFASIPSLNQMCTNQAKFLKTKNFMFGSKQDTLNFLTNEQLYRNQSPYNIKSNYLEDSFNYQSRS